MTMKRRFLRRPIRRTEGPVVPGRRIFIGLRTYDEVAHRTRNIPGLSIRAFDFTPNEVHRLILDALNKAATAYQKAQELKQEIAAHVNRHTRRHATA